MQRPPCLSLGEALDQADVKARSSASAHVVNLRVVRAGGWLPGDEYVLEYAQELARCSSAVEGAAREGGGGEMVRESGGEEEREDDAEQLELRLRVREKFGMRAHMDGGGVAMVETRPSGARLFRYLTLTCRAHTPSVDRRQCTSAPCARRRLATRL